MLLLIHQCQHDIKVGQGGEIIQAGWRQQLILDWRLRPKLVQPFTNSSWLINLFAFDICTQTHSVCKGAGDFERPGKLCVFGTSRTSNGLKSRPQSTEIDENNTGTKQVARNPYNFCQPDRNSRKPQAR